MAKRTPSRLPAKPSRRAEKAQPAEEEADLSQPIRLKRLERVRFRVPIIGETPLILHQWSEKAKREMMEKGGPAQPKKQRDKRDPDADYKAARYFLDEPRSDGLTDGVMAVAFKAAIVQAARAFENVTMTQLKQFIYVHGEAPRMLVPIIGKPVMREDMVRVGKGLNKTADIRWRPEYWPWSVDLELEWPSTVFDIESILTLLDAAGIGGIGEWRPTAPNSMTGIYGKFRVDFEALQKMEQSHGR